MKTMTAMELPSLLHVAQAWLYQNHKYTYMSHGKPVTLLPSVSIEYKDLLDKFQIPYRLTDDGKLYEFWDPEICEGISLTLPLYVFTGANYRYIKEHTGTVVTNETTDAAISLWKIKIRPEVEKREEEKRQKQFHADLKHTLSNRIACGADTSLKVPDLSSCARRETYINSDGIHCKIFPVRTMLSVKGQRALRRAYEELLNEDSENADFSDARYTTDFVAIFNLDKVQKDAIVEMLVPKGTEPIFVGKNGWQVREWCMKLGLRKIIVKGA